LNHFGDGAFLGGAIADDRLLHFARREFEDLESGFSGRHETCAARFAHEKRGLEILRKEQAFDNADGRMVLLNSLSQFLENVHQAPRSLPGSGTLDGALREKLRNWASQSNDAEAGSTQRGVNAKNDLVASGRGGSGATAFKNGFRRPFFSGDAIF
jgi:hypothetical protein